MINMGSQNLSFVGNVIHNDINTHQSKSNDRFDGEMMESYFKYFQKLNSEVMGGLNE